MLRNSLRGLIPTQKQLLYRSCILPIILYGFQLWYYNKALLVYSLKKLRKIQRRAAIWILGVFCTSPPLSIEAAAGLISIYLHLQNLVGDFSSECICYYRITLSSLFQSQDICVKNKRSGLNIFLFLFSFLFSF